jgi:putative ABC transport system permease protein
VVRVEKWPWIFEDNYPWWKYFKRPQTTSDEFEFLRNNVTQATAICIFAEKDNTLLQHTNNSKSDVHLVGMSYQYNEVYEVPIESGRYFSVQEIDMARNVAIIGADVADALFPYTSAVGKNIGISSQKYRVIAVLSRKGENLIEAPSIDDNCFIPYGSFQKIYQTNQRYGGIASAIALKAYEYDKECKLLENELEGLMRRSRGLRPLEESNFALNRTEAFQTVLDNIFGVIGIAGWLIGSFSILVGGFGIANIMFVSVKERTVIIGIQKALGAKNYFILFQFLFEAIFLSLLGGGVGLLLVYFLSFISIGSLELTLSLKNIILGLGVASGVGVVAGLLPAFSAANMDPVEAIRSQ